MSGYFVHPTSIVDDNVEIGEGTKVWHFCHIQSGARIGQNCSFGQNVNVSNNVKVGDGVKVQNNVSLYEGVELGDYVLIHAGYAIEKLTEQAAKESLEAWDELLEVLDEEDKEWAAAHPDQA